jgi:hypothetical protein
VIIAESYGAGETHAQLAPDLLHTDRAPFIGEAGVARDHEQGRIARQGSYDVLGNPVGEKLLLRVAAHIGEGQHRDRRFVGQRQWLGGSGWRLLSGGSAIPNPISPHGPRDVLDLLLAHVLEGVIEPVAHLVTHHPADADPAGLGALRRSCVPSSSAPIRREYSATSAARIAVRRRTGGMTCPAVDWLNQV